MSDLDSSKFIVNILPIHYMPYPINFNIKPEFGSALALLRFYLIRMLGREALCGVGTDEASSITTEGLKDLL